MQITSTHQNMFTHNTYKIHTYACLNTQCLDYIQPSPIHNQGATHNTQMNVQMCAYWQPHTDTDTHTLYTCIVPHCVTHKRRPQQEMNTQGGCVLPQCMWTVQGSLEGEEELQRRGRKSTNTNTHIHATPPTHPCMHPHPHTHA